MENGFSDLAYLFKEMDDLLKRTRSDIPEDFFKVFSDYVYHSNKILKEMEVEYAKLIETWDCSVCELHGLPRK
jgi:hypothetical protein